jgi:Glycosyltransferases involved in cell wall biogenesis
MVSPSAIAASAPQSQPELPLVSCILPTKDRAAFIPYAIQSYQSQTYPAKELIIVDNGDDSTEAMVQIHASVDVRYYRVTGTRTTGEMRNLCAKYAYGEFICHFDSDDWSAPERVSDQVARLGEFGVVTGYNAMLFYDERDGQCYQWRLSPPTVYVLGTSLCYRREWWRHHPFKSIRIGEDLRFFQQAWQEAHRLVPTASAGQLMVARVHAHQTSRKSLTRRSYQPVSNTLLPQGFPCGSILSAT